jgi:alkylated DNA repair dioxygenase AlkB
MATESKKKVVIQLPLQHGDVKYIEKFISQKRATDLYNWCKENLEFGQHKIQLFGKYIDQPRKTCALGIENYSYSGLTIKGSPIPEIFDRIIDRLMRYLPEGHPRPNVILCNYYEDGRQYIGAHSDKEDFLVPGSCISGLSLGATRRFDIIPKKKGEEEKVSQYLTNGSMIIMGKGTQENYKHTIPKELKVKEGRINLTFRCSGEK